MSLESKRCPANHKRTSLIYPPPSPGGNGAYSPQPSPHTHPDLAFHSTSPTILPGEVTPSGQNLFSPHIGDVDTHTHTHPKLRVLMHNPSPHACEARRSPGHSLIPSSFIPTVRTILRSKEE